MIWAILIGAAGLAVSYFAGLRTHEKQAEYEIEYTAIAIFFGSWALYFDDSFTEKSFEFVTTPAALFAYWWFAKLANGNFHK